MTRRPAIASALIAASALATAACSGSGGQPAGTATATATPTATATATAAAEHAEFGYSGDEGPEHWGELSEDYAACADGSAQSPIDLTAAAPAQLPDISLDYVPADVTLTDNGHSVQADEPAGSALSVDGHRYDLVQLHVHVPSEHEVDGALADGELHLVHKDADGRIAVVGILLQAGAENTALAPYFDSLPAEVGRTTQVPDLDVAAVLPADLSTYRYEGSLTTPPCTEGVHWYVLATPVEVSAAQLAAFSEVIEANNRPVQPADGRELVLDAADS